MFARRPDVCLHPGYSSNLDPRLRRDDGFTAPGATPITFPYTPIRKRYFHAGRERAHTALQRR
jgi:hypothetical protein